MISHNLLLLLFIVYLVSIFGTICYKKFAIKFNILANLNFRTLHQTPTPRGGGIVFSITFIASVMLLAFLGVIQKDLINVFGLSLIHI